MSTSRRITKNETAVLATYPYRDCRTEGHDWRKPLTIPYTKGGMSCAVPYGWPLYRQCPGCKAFWSRAYNRPKTAKIFDRRWYPEQLALPLTDEVVPYVLAGMGASTKQRSLVFLRMLIDDEGEAYVEP